MQFNKILKDLRLELGLTQTQLAAKSNLAPSCIAMFETNRREPNANSLIALSSALNVSTDYLLGLEDDFGTHSTTPTSDEYSVQERKIIEQYRSLPEQLKKLVQDQLDIYSSSTPELPKFTTKK